MDRKLQKKENKAIELQPSILADVHLHLFYLFSDCPHPVLVFKKKRI